jgi:DNA-binding transcriptional regulator YiaG
MQESSQRGVTLPEPSEDYGLCAVQIPQFILRLPAYHLILKWDYPRSGLAKQCFSNPVPNLSKSLRSKAYLALVREIRSARKNAGLSQQEVADRLGVTQSWVAKIEIGERRLDVVEFLRLVAVLETSSKEILRRVSVELD